MKNSPQLNDEPTNLIYGLIDPRSRLIRYVGMSSCGMRRPKQHRSTSCPNTYCRRWVQQLQELRLDYEIVVLETVSNAADLSQAECWWIAFGKACGWPLTNLTAGGGPSEAAITEQRRRREARAAAARAATQIVYTPEQLAVFEREREIRRKAMERDPVAFLRGEPVDIRDPALVAQRCFELFEKHAGSNQMFIEVVIGARVTPDRARDLYDDWQRLKGTRQEKT
jgi:hypothetical protein